MRPVNVSLHLPSFVLGFAFGGVIVATMHGEANRRRREQERADLPRIDGARPLAKAALDAQPAPEANTTSSTPRLESEAPDVDPRSQRWGQPW